MNLEPNELIILEKTLKTTCHPGGMIIFQCPPNRIAETDVVIRKIYPQLKAHGIGVLLFDDECSLVMIPEAKRALGIGRTAR